MKQDKGKEGTRKTFAKEAIKKSLSLVWETAPYKLKDGVSKHICLMHAKELLRFTFIYIFSAEILHPTEIHENDYVLEPLKI